MNRLDILHMLKDVLERSSIEVFVLMPGCSAPVHRRVIGLDTALEVLSEEITKEEYETIREVQEKDIEEKYKKQMRELEKSKITLTLADKYVGKDAITAFVGYRPQTITYEIQKKE